MVPIEVQAESEIAITRPADEVLGFVLDAARTARLFPGMESVRSLYSDEIELTLVERRAFGKSFRGQYVARYVPRGPYELVWTTVRGNMRSSGVWSVVPGPEQTRLRVEIQLSLEAPVPALLQRPAAMFGYYETKRGLALQLQRIRRALEEPSASAAPTERETSVRSSEGALSDSTRS